MKIGDRVIVNRDSEIKAAGIITDIVANARQPILYGVLCGNRVYYCKEEEIEFENNKGVPE